MFGSYRSNRLTPRWPRDRVLSAGLALFALIVVPLVCRAGGPSSQPAQRQTPDGLMSKWLADLASPDAQVRETARVHLVRLRRSDLPAFERVVQRSAPLAPSQALLLKQIVQEIYLSGENDYEKDAGHGFLGILMDSPGFQARADLAPQHEGSASPGVVVADRIPGFCASRMLLDGDVILGTTDPPQVFTNSDELRASIGVLEPGTTVRLHVLRRGRVIDVPVTLDAMPVEASSVWTANAFRDRRALKFNDYWQHTFGALLKARVG